MINYVVFCIVRIELLCKLEMMMLIRFLLNKEFLWWVCDVLERMGREVVVI